MPSQTVTVGSSVGLHARPAALIAQAATETGVPVTIGTNGGQVVDAGSALLIMTLGAKCGDQVVVSSDDEAAVQKVAALVAQDLDA
jgi:phosphocarrier protein HPr